jgi:FMN phosphatase YigB (HAD superfamily)
LAAYLDNISTIFFDFGNTLGCSTLSISEVWVAAAAERGIVLQQDALLEAMRVADRICNPKVYEYKGRMPEFWGLYDACVLDRLDIADSDGSLSRAVGSAFLDAERLFRVFPETHSVLSELKWREYALGIISNNTEEMLDRMKSLGLVGYFDTITYSQEAGAEKPDPAPFELALRRAGRAPQECVHIGDSFEQDIVGARRAGIKPILIDRSMKYPEADCVTIRSLNEILNES